MDGKNEIDRHISFIIPAKDGIPMRAYELTEKIVDQDTKGQMQLLGIIHDITDIHNAKESALHDPMFPSLYNRVGFYTALEEQRKTKIEDGRRKTDSAPNINALLVFDVDKLKEINDNYRHAEGDKYLEKIVEVFQEFLRKEDIFARFGGDEFTIYIPGISDKALKEKLEAIQLKLKETKFHDKSLKVSMGCITDTNPSVNIEELLSEADTLMYEAKNSGRGEETSNIKSNLI